jgi:hypothetical protein
MFRIGSQLATLNSYCAARKDTSGTCDPQHGFIIMFTVVKTKVQKIMRDQNQTETSLCRHCKIQKVEVEKGILGW